MLIVRSNVSAQTKASLFDHSPLTAGLTEVIDFQGIWEDDRGYRHVVPANYFDRKRLFLAKTFDIPNYEALQDTVYIYFEAVAWSSEIFLNGFLLKVTEDPFAEHLLPIRKDLLQPNTNRLTVEMRTDGAAYEWYPERFLGIFRQVSLLQADTTGNSVNFPEILDHAPRAAMIAPWSEGGGYLDDTTVLRMASQGLFSFPYEIPLVFPFKPSNKAMQYLARKGLKVLASAAHADSIAAYNQFPFSGELGNWNITFWRDLEMRPTSHYDHFQSVAGLGKPPIKDADRTALLICLLIPLLSLLAVKMAAPRVYSNMAEFITKNKIYLELIVNNKFLKTEQRWLINLVRLILTGSSVALYLYYIELTGDTRILNFFSERSILGSALGNEEIGLYTLFWKVTGIVIVLNFLKYIFLDAIGRIFRAYNLAVSVQNLDVFAAFPLNILLLAPATFIFFLDANMGWIMMYVWLSIFGLYGIRRVNLIYVGLGRLYPVSVSLKILYICTLEILPWVLLI